jgi:biopolymer transport protein ExbD
MRITIGLALALACAGCGDDEKTQDVAAVRAELERVQSRVKSLQRELERAQQPDPAKLGAPTGPTQLGQTVQLELARAKMDDHIGKSALVSVLPDGIDLDGSRVTLEELEFGLKKARAADPEASLIVSAAPDVPYERVIEVMDLAKEVGITRFAIATRPHEAPEPIPEPEPEPGP